MSWGSHSQDWDSRGSIAYLLEPLEGLCGELVLLAVLLEVGNQLGEDRLELLESGGHVDGSAGQVGAGNRYTLAVRGDLNWLIWLYGSCKWSREPMEALKSSKQRNGGQRKSVSCIVRVTCCPRETFAIHRMRAVRV